MGSKFKRKYIRAISFFGDANISPKDPVYKDAFDVAKILAEEGYTIVNGGGPGVMNAATSGAQAGNGETISISFDPADAPGFEGRYIKNVAARQIEATNYVERMFKLMEHGDIYIMFKGGTGTLSELGTAWVLAKLYFGHHKPFILYGKFWPKIIDVLRKNLNIDKQELSVFEIVERKEDVLPAVERMEKKMECT